MVDSRRSSRPRPALPVRCIARDRRPGRQGLQMARTATGCTSRRNPLLLLEVHCPNCRAPLTQGEQVRPAGPRRRRPDRTARSGSARSSATTRCETDLAIGEGDVVDVHLPVVRAQPDGGHAPASSAARRWRRSTWRAASSMEFCARRGCRGHALGGYRRRRRDDEPAEPDVQDPARLTRRTARSRVPYADRTGGTTSRTSTSSARRGG